MGSPRRLKRGIRFAFLAAILLVGVGIVWSQEDRAPEAGKLPAARQAILAGVSGDVQVKVNGQWQPAVDGMTLQEQDEVKTGADGSVVLILDRLDEGDRFKVQKESNVSLSQLQQGPQLGTKATELDVAFGKVLVHVGKLGENSRFEVKTPTATTGVRGTSFGVFYDSGNKTTDLEVYEDGPVLFQSRAIKAIAQETVSVEAGIKLSVPSYRDPRQIPLKPIPPARLKEAVQEIFAVRRTPVPSIVKVDAVYNPNSGK